ncbi:hypothetical protein GCM10007362_39240 [Saccharibacillus endophyticus]|uniref:Amidase domain-containing protein n=1 Tax=Saccharibacillus endophyticus TaxID=2060666 RepID=A0ABQ2A1G4_9BACL|nr:hypothetical protein GCM10007362_39240 [Saccharibacillus endophyticus]
MVQETTGCAVAVPLSLIPFVPGTKRNPLVGPLTWASPFKLGIPLQLDAAETIGFDRFRASFTEHADCVAPNPQLS